MHAIVNPAISWKMAPVAGFRPSLLGKREGEPVKHRGMESEDETNSARPREFSIAGDSFNRKSVVKASLDSFPSRRLLKQSYQH